MQTCADCPDYACAELEKFFTLAPHARDTSRMADGELNRSGCACLNSLKLPTWPTSSTSACPANASPPIDVLQPKCLNLPAEDFARPCGRPARRAAYHGKWIQTHTDRGWLLLNLGMGGEMLLVDRAASCPKSAAWCSPSPTAPA